MLEWLLPRDEWLSDQFASLCWEDLGGLVAVDNDADRCLICAVIVEIRVSHLYGVQKQDAQMNYGTMEVALSSLSEIH